MNPKPVEIEPGLFVGQAQTKDNEPVFCYLQKMTEDAFLPWCLYHDSTVNMTSPTRGILPLLAKKIIKDGSVSYSSNDFYDRNNGSLGFSSKADFQNFVDAMTQKGFTNGSKKMQAIINCGAGVTGLNLAATGYTYVAYLSKTPHFSIPNLTQYNAQRRMTLQEYMTHYQDLLMCVGVNINPAIPDSYHVRGIFRNPYSFLEGTYKNISMILHGFIGAVACEYFPDKREERASPLVSQLYIMCRELKPEDVRLPSRYEHATIIAAGIPNDGDGFDIGENVYIKAEALKEYYLTAGTNPKCQVDLHKSPLNQSDQKAEDEEEQKELKPSF